MGGGQERKAGGVMICPYHPAFILAPGEPCPAGCGEPTAVDERIARLERTVAKLVAFVGAMPEGDEVIG